MSVVYLAVLLGGIACMVLLDVRYRLVFASPRSRTPRRAAIVLGVGVAFFLVWDLAGIGLGIFHRGDNAVSTGILLAPELPVEELVFLAFLSYLTLVLYTGAVRLIAARESHR
ncbi:lycopene cyclase domain-containing protein [Agromyces subbeticus]|uniref:lycopene cyclase domain-containing protein n=1 Tax=Agromyces subbeticus TaxID=293890 RepID=UPI00041A12F8|nr:lycopene cyclase domain-containing protein [Agromyces subbeticus]